MRTTTTGEIRFNARAVSVVLLSFLFSLYFSRRFIRKPTRGGGGKAWKSSWLLFSSYPLADSAWTAAVCVYISYSGFRFSIPTDRVATRSSIYHTASQHVIAADCLQRKSRSVGWPRLRESIKVCGSGSGSAVNQATQGPGSCSSSSSSSIGAAELLDCCYDSYDDRRRQFDFWQCDQQEERERERASALRHSVPSVGSKQKGRREQYVI